ncbi:arginine repressor [Limosilactobacillus coleohominis]|jgi:transcriptional regulator of arginine metabolism|uniref:Arginine repressor n=1 Tax=Limosilactobacillus coleohominis TaxID=181675 RepID=A0ABS2GWD8_9LACO|nr:ArgR family transcriptional regulator [Limosilactobacillus coleohominis]MBM6940607.1 ArgR family transcriptional regulator [Limosilactobacillus coleohominis]MBM6954684.1 ArgR family transcriptional regulator [Limosilactobacillus coleohominis]HJA22793.1 ArgR family transcriptional regulator [Candidatus Limosilactobacillus intestinavium]
MKKVDRQAKIREIIEDNNVERQEDLVQLLLDAGIHVTQATISRDIKEMQLVKVPNSDGGYRYSMPTRRQENREQQLANAINNDLQSLKRSDRFLSLSMRPGHAPMAAVLIKRLNFPEVFTAIGDDTSILVVCQSSEDAIKFEQILTNLN